MFLVGIAGGPLGVGLIGVAIELTLLRRIYGVPSCSSCSPPSALCLPCGTWSSKVWGPLDILGRAPRAAEPSSIRPSLSRLRTVLIAMGPLVLGLSEGC